MELTSKEQGSALRSWREWAGDRLGHKLTLEKAAELISGEAERQSISESSRSTPRTHASLTRWELANVKHTIEGLKIIAKVYGISYAELTAGPPEAGSSTGLPSLASIADDATPVSPIAGGVGLTAAASCEAAAAAAWDEEVERQVEAFRTLLKSKNPMQNHELRIQSPRTIL